MTTRRNFISHTSAFAVGASAGIRPGFTVHPVGGTPTIDPAVRINADPAVRDIAMRAIDAAKAAGATYADVRITRLLQQSTVGGSMTRERTGLPQEDRERYGVGVRALVGGGWGFAASPSWDLNEAARLAQDAVAQARVNSPASAPSVDLGRIPVATGSWSTPIQTDPFTISIEERQDMLATWIDLARQAYRGARNFHSGQGFVGVPPGGAGVSFDRQERAVATSDGAYFTQTIHQTAGGFYYKLTDILTHRETLASANNLGMRAGGWDVYLDANVPDQIPRLITEAREKMSAPLPRDGTIGRYDVVFDAASMASLVSGTVGIPTQLDRALGYEANASGTSYLTDPLSVLGSLQIGSPVFSVAANRSLPQGLASVKWDDEGVEPADFTLVRNGVLTDFQTTREQAAWLAPYYQKAGLPVRSHGCAAAESALSITMQHMPNLALTPGRSEITMNDLIRDTARGIAVYGASFAVDFQGQSGMAMGMQCREIVNGRLGQELSGLGILFSTSELLKNIVAVGGPASVEHHAAITFKGQPSQSMPYTVSAVPAKIVRVSFVDPRRRL